jgi:predicted transcriptional regulator
MRRRAPPPPTKSAEMIRQYLEIIDSKQRQGGRAKRFDIYRRAGNEAQTDKIIKYLMENGLIHGNDEDGYCKTEKGEGLHEILKKRDLVGILTRDFHGKTLRPW